MICFLFRQRVWLWLPECATPKDKFPSENTRRRKTLDVEAEAVKVKRAIHRKCIFTIQMIHVQESKRVLATISSYLFRLHCHHHHRQQHVVIVARCKRTTNEIIKGEFRRVFIMLFYRISLTPVTQRRTATPPMLLMVLLLPPLEMMMPTENTFFFFYFNLPMNACMREKRYWRSILQFCSLKWSVDNFLSRLIVCAVCVCWWYELTISCMQQNGRK